MIFTVTDDGKGMTKEVLEKLQESIGKEKGDKSIDGFGIGNVKPENSLLLRRTVRSNSGKCGK